MLHSVNPTEIHARRIISFKLVVMWDAIAWAFVPFILFSYMPSKTSMANSISSDINSD